jgi:type I restriction enzyme R subunit
LDDARDAPGEAKTEEELDDAVRQIVWWAVSSEGVVDIFAAAGLKKPDIAILSEEFLRGDARTDDPPLPEPCH